MTVRVVREFTVDVPCEKVWNFISDPEKRAKAISVVRRFELGDSHGRTATWYIELPIPLIKQTISVETRELERRESEFVKFVGRSKVMQVVGEHRLTPHDGGCSLRNEFVVDGHLPGVERFFKRNLDTELRNLERALRRDVGRDR